MAFFWFQTFPFPIQEAQWVFSPPNSGCHRFTRTIRRHFTLHKPFLLDKITTVKNLQWKSNKVKKNREATETIRRNKQNNRSINWKSVLWRRRATGGPFLLSVRELFIQSIWWSTVFVFGASRSRLNIRSQRSPSASWKYTAQSVRSIDSPCMGGQRDHYCHRKGINSWILADRWRSLTDYRYDGSVIYIYIFTVDDAWIEWISELRLCSWLAISGCIRRSQSG